ncbi:MAG: DNA-directed DNA polymerase [Candidatus Nanoarchaeia archaeon]|nr:DNA-directed DNA polymerase [Candidatus Nanoarchaeia archaeon]MDD5357936.1 DNA-directed DNA polymerase [Candidatus Nanoarchaeia archaeon]MDD5588855.1 DNA-directed DNA polymerase [Candidatus Nanoarchaeia archaeon]
MKLDFIPVDYDYFDFEGRNFAKVIGRSSNGKRVCIIDSCDVYFWAILKEKISQKEIERLSEKIGEIQLDVKGRRTKVEKVELHNKKFLGNEVKALKIFATNYKDLHDIADQLGMPEIEKRRGYDLGFISHYIMEKKLNPLNWYEINGEILNNSLEFGGIDSSLNVDLCIKVDSIKQSDKQNFSPKVLAFDIEADDLKIGEGELLMVSFISENFKKVITWKKCTKKLDYVECVKDEAELIERFVEIVKKISPDFLVGYFTDGFDFPYIKARAMKHKIKLDIGLDGSQPRFSKSGVGRFGTAKIDGIVHIDLLRFIETAYSQYMQSEVMSLNEVANEFLGEGKKEFEFRHSSKIDSDGWEKYFEYNLHDSVLTYKIFEKIWPDLLEFTRVMQEPVFDVSRNGMSRNVEDYILHNLSRFNEIPERRPGYDEIGERKKREKYVGAFVFEPTAGLYQNLGIFDFTSYWPSIIVTFNLSKSTMLEKKEKNSLEVDLKDKKVYFSKKPGFFPEMLKEIIEKRKKYKKELAEKFDVIKKARSNAFKLLANASYGYLGFFGARYYCPEASASATSISRDFIKEIIAKINNEGYKTIYSDTDSIAFLLNEKSKQKTLEFLKKLNSGLPGIMELELEDFYKRGIWVTTRTGEFGAKKKYALITEKDKLKIRGFETVRRDWCALAREIQNNVLLMILEDGDEKRALEYLKKLVKEVKERKINVKKMMIRTQLKKPISEYKSITPHVVAAQKMLEKEMPIDMGTLIEYYIAETDSKKKLVRDKVKLSDEPGEYNIEYYLKHQILPAVENIMQVFNFDVNTIIETKKQKTLGEF